MFDALAKMLGVRRDQAEDAIHSERAARVTLNRRGFLLAGATAGAALATGAIWSIPGPIAEVKVGGRAVVSAVDTKRGLVTFDSLLKELYTGEQVDSMLFRESPLLRMLPTEKPLPAFQYRCSKRNQIAKAWPRRDRRVRT
jgi:hypothetical protein